MPSSLIKLFGSEEPPRETQILHAGPLTVELDGGNLRYIRYRGHEAIRAISYVVIDQFWGTFSPAINDFQVEQEADGFTVTYGALCEHGDGLFRYEAKITGSVDGTLEFMGLGRAVTDFLTNRTGFVVLHPIAGVSGRPVKVGHVDGSTVETVFPERIDPRQPIVDIRSLTHEVCPGLSVTCTMTGDTFEMEDQRNWTDASYKTHVRPLGLPFPYTLAAGERLLQSVKLTFAGEPAAAGGASAATDRAPIKVGVGQVSGPLPAFAMALEPDVATMALQHVEALRSLKPAFVSCLYDARNDDGPSALHGFAAVGEMLHTDLALEVIVPANRDPADVLGEVARIAREADVAFGSVAVTSSDDLGFVVPGSESPDASAFDALYAAARAAFPGARLGGGSFVYFTELNRKPPPFDQLDFVCHTTCAIVHAADDRSVTETLESLPFVVASARALFGDKEYCVGPAAIATRSSPFGSDPTPNPENRRVTMTRCDPRQRGLLGAAWYLGYAARMAEGGVDKVILGAPVGEFGLVHHRMSYEQPWYDDAGGVYPAYHVLRGVYAASRGDRLATTVSEPRALQALALRGGKGRELWLANLTGEAREVEIDGFAPDEVEACVLDEDSFRTCAKGPGGFDETARQTSASAVTLTPYAVWRLRVAG